MDKVPPAILNKVRGQNNVGPDSINHVHHLPHIPTQPTGIHDVLDTASETFPTDRESPPDTKRITSLFRAAITAVKGQREQRNDPPPA